MKRITFFLLMVLCSASIAAAMDVPEKKGRVNDYAALLSSADAADIERMLADFESGDKSRIAVLTVPSLGGLSVEDYSIAVAEKWKLGRKGIDSGVLLLIARNERKVRIEVGYGLEGRLTDLIAGRIISEEMKPSLKNGDYASGIRKGVAAIMSAVKGEFKDDAAAKSSGSARGLPWPAAVIIGVIILIALIAGFLTRKRTSSCAGQRPSRSLAASSGDSQPKEPDRSKESGISDEEDSGGRFGGGGATGGF